MSDRVRIREAERLLLTRQQVEEMCAISRSEIYRRMAEGTFPKPVRLGENCVRWRLADITAWAAALPEA